MYINIMIARSSENNAISVSAHFTRYKQLLTKIGLLVGVNSLFINENLTYQLVAMPI